MEIETADVDMAPSRRGRKPDPVLAYKKAHQKAEKARLAYQKVQNIAEAKEEAEALEQEAYSELQAYLETLPAPGSSAE